MTSMREDFLTLADDLRGMRGPDPGFDVQTVQLKIVARTWSDGRLGSGTLVETILTTLYKRYKMRELTSREVAGSGGRYEMGDVKVNPVTPSLILPIASATNTTPIVVTTTDDHELETGAPVRIAGVLGLTAANNTTLNVEWTATRLSTKTFALNGSVGNAPYTSGGTAQVCGYTPEQLKPPGAQGAGIIYVLTGATHGDYQLVDLATDRPFRYALILRRMRTTP